MKWINPFNRNVFVCRIMTIVCMHNKIKGKKEDKNVEIFENEKLKEEAICLNDNDHIIDTIRRNISGPNSIDI